MKKRVAGFKLSRDRDSRRALTRGLIASLVKYGKITTTKTKAKVIQPKIDHIMTEVGKNTITAKRRVLSDLGNDRKTTELLFQNYLKLTKERNSGFTRIINLKRRKGDNAEIVTISFVENAKNNTTKKS